GRHHPGEQQAREARVARRRLGGAALVDRGGGLVLRLLDAGGGREVGCGRIAAPDGDLAGGLAALDRGGALGEAPGELGDVLGRRVLAFGLAGGEPGLRAAVDEGSELGVGRPRDLRHRRRRRRRTVAARIALRTVLAADLGYPGTCL